MARGNGQAATLGAEAAPAVTGEVVLAVELGRGFGGKSTGLAELVWRARNQGREVIVADGDPRSRTLANPGFERMVREGAAPVLMTCLACIDLVRRRGLGLYAAAAGDGEAPLDPVEQFMVEDWLADLEGKRAKAGVAAWLP